MKSQTTVSTLSFAQSNQAWFVGMDFDNHIRRGDVFAVSRLGGEPLLEGHVDGDGLDMGDYHDWFTTESE